MSARTSHPRPLSGKRVLVTRARGQAGVLSHALRRLGASVIEIPTIEIKPPRSYRQMDRALREISRYDWLILTSVNGVATLLARVKKLAIPTRRLSAIKIAAIGPATRHAVQAHRLRVQVMPHAYVAEAVVRALRGRVKGRRVLLVRAAAARDVIPAELRKAGARVDVVAAYRTVVPRGLTEKLQAVLESVRKPDFITFTSSSTARNFAAMARRTKLDGIRLVSIGPVTSATLRELGLRPDIEAKTYTMAGLVRAIARSV